MACFTSGPVRHVAATWLQYVLVQKIVVLLVPMCLPVFEATFADGRLTGVIRMVGGAAYGIGFWGFGTVYALPAFFGSKRLNREAMPSLDWQQFLMSLPVIILNAAIGSVLGSVVLWAGLPNESFDWHSLPTLTFLARDMAVCMASTEIIYFYMHRWFHMNPTLYRLLHKMHHARIISTPVSFFAIYSHPLETVCNVGQAYIGSLICGCHILTVTVYIAIQMFEDVRDHAGLDLEHDAHHAKSHVNFGIYCLMDRIYNTYEDPKAAAQIGQSQHGHKKTRAQLSNEQLR